MTSKLSATVRMYRLNELGDCFLISFAVGATRSRMLIDCGSFRNSGASIARLKEIVQHISTECGGNPLDVVVGTHQHNDHLSGFVHCEAEFREIGIEEVWLSWLDDPKDQMAHGIGEAHKNLMRALFDASTRLAGSSVGSKGMRSIEVLNDMLGFYGAKGNAPPELPANAVKILKGLGRKDPVYLRPGRVLEMPGLPPGSVRIHVLGPPRDSELLYRKDPRTGESYDHALTRAGLSAIKWLDAAASHKGVMSREEEQYPFSESVKHRGAAGRSAALRKMVRRYKDPAQAWRTIDDDWLEQGEALALYLDSFTNNSSVVLAIELVASEKVLLFAADAQTGNWVSWSDVKWATPSVSTGDLLARTVLYKVGHHGSHNATLVAALEKMTHPDLMALIPVHKKDPNITKDRGWKMPARNLLKKLRERTSNRVLQMDDAPAKDCDPKVEPAKGAWKRCGIKPKVTPLFAELEISGEIAAGARGV